jgi:hypothetical protein
MRRILFGFGALRAGRGEQRTRERRDHLPVVRPVQPRWRTKLRLLDLRTMHGRHLGHRRLLRNQHGVPRPPAGDDPATSRDAPAIRLLVWLGGLGRRAVVGCARIGSMPRKPHPASQLTTGDGRRAVRHCFCAWTFQLARGRESKTCGSCTSGAQRPSRPSSRCRRATGTPARSSGCASDGRSATEEERRRPGDGNSRETPFKVARSHNRSPSRRP